MITAEYKRYLIRIALLGLFALLGGLVAVVAVQFDNKIFTIVGFAVLILGVVADGVLIIVGQIRYGKRVIVDGLSAARDWHSNRR